MKRIAAVLALALVGLTLTGCERPKDNFEICVEAGGSYEKGFWGDSCTMPVQEEQEKR